MYLAITENPIYKFLNNVKEIIRPIRTVNELFNGLKNINIPKNSDTQALFSAIDKPIRTTSFFEIIELPKTLYSLKKSVCKLITNKHDTTSKESNRLTNFVKTIRKICSVIGAINLQRATIEIFTEAVKISSTAASVFLGIGTAGQAISSILEGRGLHKTVTDLEKFTTDFEKQPNNNFKKLSFLIGEINDPKKSKKFNLNDEEKEKLIAIDPNSDADAGVLFAALASRIKTQRNLKIVSLVNGALGLVHTALRIASIANPIMALSFFAVNLAVQGAKHIYSKVKQFQFDVTIGLINNIDQNSPTTAKIAAFGKWYFKNFNLSEFLSVTNLATLALQIGLIAAGLSDE